MLDRLWRFLEDHDLPADAAVRAGFERYVALLERANRAMNLIGSMSSEALVTTLICDSLVPLTLGVPLPGPLLDLGSGAGLPGIPLALAAPGLEVHLVEPRERRYRFLGQALRALGRPGLQRHQGRVDRPGEQRALGLPEHLGTAVAKAVLPIAEWLELASGLVAPDTGRIVAMCSARDWDDTGVPVAAALGLEVLAERRVQWPDTAPRVCAVLRVS